LGDEAAVDLRVVDNLAIGYGMGWNVAERVNAYADPLSVLAISAVDVWVHQPYVAVWVLSLILTSVVVALVAVRIASDVAGALLAIALLTFSKSFIEYSSGGFQTPLTVALLAAFWTAYWRRRPDGRRLLRLTLCAALCALTDASAVVLMVPGIVTAARRMDARTRARALAGGATPLLLWLIFASVYYGFFVPNPAIAWWH